MGPVCGFTWSLSKMYSASASPATSVIIHFRDRTVHYGHHAPVMTLCVHGVHVPGRIGQLHPDGNTSHPLHDGMINTIDVPLRAGEETGRRQVGRSTRHRLSFTGRLISPAGR